MQGVEFPFGMSEMTKIDENTPVMVYPVGQQKSDPQIIRVAGLREYLKGTAGTGNNGFIDGDELQEIIQDLISKNPELNNHIAVFDEKGGLTAGGTFDQFVETFTEHMPEYLK